MFETVKTPCYIVDEKKLRSNLEILKRVQEEADCKILLAQKAFSMFRVYPLIGEYLAGTTASGLYEARLGREEMGKENHVFAPAFRSEDMEELDEICDHVIFNSMAQFESTKAPAAMPASAFGSIRSALLRKDMPSMTPAPSVHVWESAGSSCLRSCRMRWRVCIFTPSASRTPMIW